MDGYICKCFCVLIGCGVDLYDAEKVAKSFIADGASLTDKDSIFCIWAVLKTEFYLFCVIDWMGRKKVVKKSKEEEEEELGMSVSAGEGSSMAEEAQQLAQTPRKRGRPRKVVVEKDESEDEDGDEVQDVTKRGKTEDKKDGGEAEEDEAAVSGQCGKRSRAKRKSRPRKSY